MSEFVNYNKRSVKLPPGCKDLIDVLRPKAARQDLKPCPELTVGGDEIAAVSSIPKHINNFLKRSTQSILLIGTPNDHVGFELRRLIPGEICASIHFRDDPTLATRARELLARYELDAPVPTEIPAQFFVPGATTWDIFPIRPFPSSTAPLIEIATAAFRELSNVTEESRLHFQYYCSEE